MLVSLASNQSSSTPLETVENSLSVSKETNIHTPADPVCLCLSSDALTAERAGQTAPSTLSFLQANAGLD